MICSVAPTVLMLVFVITIRMGFVILILPLALPVKDLKNHNGKPFSDSSKARQGSRVRMTRKADMFLLF